MGCEPSHPSHMQEIRVSIIDSSFMKASHSDYRAKFEENQILYQCYISMLCFLDQFAKKYTNHVIVNDQNFTELVVGLRESSCEPNIYVVTDKPQAQLQEMYQHVQVGKTYDEILQKILSKRLIMETDIKKTKKRIDLKILRNSNNVTFSQSMIFQQTLKVKKIVFQKYQTFQELQRSMNSTDSEFIVTDYPYHREVVNLVCNTSTRVICFCSLQEKQSYDPNIYFITNNFQQIANEVSYEKNLKNMMTVPCTKVYVYVSCPQNQKEAVSYGKVLAKYNFQMRKCTNLSDLLHQTKYFFCLTVVCLEDDKKTIQKFMQNNLCQHRAKIISIANETECSDRGLRKTIKQLKKGYKAQRGIAKSVDIIDRHSENSKFDDIKVELEKQNIQYACYHNLQTYVNTHQFVSPYVICNFEEKFILFRYLEQIKSKSKVIVFCSKNNVNPNGDQYRRFVFNSANFGKILSFIRKNYVYNPIILNENNTKINEKQMKLKNNKQRISALKWSSGSLDGGDGKKEDCISFINISNDTHITRVKQMQKDAANLWKIPQKPLQSIQQFKKSLKESLTFLKKQYKINYPQTQFNNLLGKIQSMNMSNLVVKIRQFFQSSNELGVKINNALRMVDKIDNNQIVHLREFIYLTNLGFLSIYSMPRVGKLKLSHWTKQFMLQKCAPGSYLLSKTYLIMYQNMQQMQTTCFHRIDVELEYNSLVQADFYINSFFKYKNKYIFAPYSQFQIVGITKELDITVIKLVYRKNIEFLKCYYEENLLSKGQAIGSFFDQEMAKPASQLITPDIKSKVQRNYTRSQAFKSYRSNHIDTAVEQQLKVIHLEQTAEDFNSTVIDEMHFQLAKYYTEQDNSVQALKIIHDLMESNPGALIREQCAKMVKKLSKQIQKQPDSDIKKKMTQKCIKLDEHFENIEKEEAKEEKEEQIISEDSEEVLLDNADFQFPNYNEMPCLEVQDTFNKDLKHFKSHEKENFD